MFRTDIPYRAWAYAYADGRPALLHYAETGEMLPELGVELDDAMAEAESDGYYGDVVELSILARRCSH